MLDGISLDQLRSFLAAVDEGSFSAAGRRLSRTQSAVSEAIGTLEMHLGVTLFDRAGRYPRLTSEGVVLLADARQVLSSVDGMKARAKGMATGIEPELTVVVDVLFPIEVLAGAAQDFRLHFPGTPLRLYVEVLGAVVEPLLDGRASFSIVGSLPVLPAGLSAERLTSVRVMMVAAANHPLAIWPGVIPKEELARHVQLVLTDRSKLTAEREFGVMSPFTWRLADLFAKHAFLLNGLGWGGMPHHTVESDLQDGRLVELEIEDAPMGGLTLTMSAVYRTADPPGPAGRWMIERLKACRDRQE
ncbi:LysR family transcriptional regulator [Telmatospirillum siberiense]|uniref:LysR family transcriptional regulator n=1 Tax=Telmatospirillum siberiense TaxID=382514 RepID=A0A2N3PS35_9PROT|nr:LysR family transcriptional regulator [Telmatospirillum siberiense]PKU23217.1 LysR family transcriptional regulator [Telmatospirillum siberiense]